MSKFFTTTFQILSVFWLNGILNSAGNRMVNGQNATLYKFDLSCCITLQSSLVLSCSPSLSRVASLVRIRSRKRGKDAKLRARLGL